MSRLPFSFSRTKEKVFAVCDIGPGNASVAILQSRGASTPQVLASGNSKLHMEETSPEQEVSQIGGQIKEAAQAALTAYHAQGYSAEIGEVEIVVHAPWMKSYTVEAGIAYGTDEYIHDSLIGKLAKESLATATDIVVANLVEASVIRVELNGYPTAQPAGKHAQQVRVVSLIGECGQEIKGAILPAIQQSFPIAAMQWRSGIRALMALARQSQVLGANYLVVDIGVDVSHIVSVRGTAFEQIVVPGGIRMILSSIAAGKSPESTLTALRMLAVDSCSTTECETLRSAMAVAEQEMIKHFAEPIGKMALSHRAANDLLLVVHHDLEVWLTQFFSRIDFSQFTITAAPFVVSTPSSIDSRLWFDGELPNQSLAAGVALVNIEARS